MNADNWFEIPAVGRVPAYRLDGGNRAQVRALIVRAQGFFRLSARAWIDGNNSGDETELERQEQRSAQLGKDGERLLAPLGIACDWPGLYPSFTVRGYSEYGTEGAVLAALGHARDWLRTEGGR